MVKETGWNQFKGKETPSTVEIDESFIKAVPENSDVLDFGCAWGRTAFKLQKLDYNVTGFDLNGNVIETAMEMQGRPMKIAPQRLNSKQPMQRNFHMLMNPLMHVFYRLFLQRSSRREIE